MNDSILKHKNFLKINYSLFSILEIGFLLQKTLTGQKTAIMVCNSCKNVQYQCKTEVNGSKIDVSTQKINNFPRKATVIVRMYYHGITIFELWSHTAH